MSRFRRTTRIDKIMESAQKINLDSNNDENIGIPEEKDTGQLEKVESNMPENLILPTMYSSKSENITTIATNFVLAKDTSQLEILESSMHENATLPTISPSKNEELTSTACNFFLAKDLSPPATCTDSDLTLQENGLRETCPLKHDTNKKEDFKSTVNSILESPINEENVDTLDIFSDSEQADILDFSAGSSDYYIPNSERSSSSDESIKIKRKRVNLTHVVVPETDSDSEKSMTEPQPGCLKEPVKKMRKSFKERRADREARFLSRNSGKSYVTKSGKVQPNRSLVPLGECRMKCKDRIPESHREHIFQEFWQLGSYDDRAHYVERFIQTNEKKSHKIASKSKREVSNTYKLIYFSTEYKICKACLVKTLGETNRFLQTINEKIKKYGHVSKSERGRAASYKKISDSRLKEISDHIDKFPAYESHYARSKTAKKFLPPYLNLESMYKLYCSENSNPVCKNIYVKVFKSKKLSFKKPSIDTCNKCNLFNMKLKLETDPEKITNMKKELQIHQDNYETAYEMKRVDKSIAKNSEDTCVIAFDLQQCLPTPLLNTQTAFYKRQLWVFNFTIHDFYSNNAYCYMWPESSGGRGANQIASCLYDFITIRLPLLHPNAKFLIMYSDSASGQNKNSVVTTALMMIVNESQLLNIEHKFLVPGHTHMEVDSDHALIERAKKRTSMNIHHPRDWSQLVRTASNKTNKFSVIDMTENDFYDFSNFSKQHLVTLKKLNSMGEKFIWKGIKIMKYSKGEFPAFKYKENYKDVEYKDLSYAKRNKDYGTIKIADVPKCYDGPVPISVNKKKDLISLLEYIDPSVHSFYHELTTNTTLRDIDPDNVSDSE